MIFPAIDLIGGRCVRLYKGDFDQRTDYDIDPADMLKSYAEAGAKWVHIVDLDGAKNEQASQAALITELAQNTPLNIQTGGGLRTTEQIETLLNGGVKRVVIGSLAVTDPAKVKDWMQAFGPEKIVLALDVNMGDDGHPYPATKGWTEAGTQTLWDVLESYQDSGLATILVTDIGRDGVLGGSNTELYQDIMTRYPDLDLITSGGVGTLGHVRALKALTPYGIIIGKALFENRFTLQEAITC